MRAFLKEDAMAKSRIKNFTDQYFHHSHFSNTEKFEKEIHTTLCLIIAAGKPLQVEIIQNYFKWKKKNSAITPNS